MPAEKEAGSPKPADVFIGVIDLFAVLVPGLIAAVFIALAFGETLRNDFFFVSGLAVAGWVLGHVLHSIGSWLDPLVYDPLFKPIDTSYDPRDSRCLIPKSRRPGPVWAYFHKNDLLHSLATDVTNIPIHCGGGQTGKKVPGGMYQWARAWLNTHSPEATAHLDRLEADSKLFRSLAVLFFIAIPVLSVTPLSTLILRRWCLSSNSRSWWVAVAFAGVIFSLWRYCDLRNKMIRRCYLHYLQLRLDEARQS